MASSKTIWFGRDALGRRSLLVHWPSEKDSRFMLSSVSPPSAMDEKDDIGYENGPTELKFWEELPCAVYSLSMSALKSDKKLVGEVKRHNWTDPLLEELIKWERTYVEPKPEDLIKSHEKFSSEQRGHLHQEVLAALKESVRRRTIFSGTHLGNSPVAVLFSGGLDSMILAALLDECLDPKFGIDLLNVSFDGQSAPDRISARAGVIELRKKASLRRWNLVEIDAELPKLTLETKHVMSLINPSNTYMDLNIGIALWLAAGGDGWVCEEIGRNDDSEHQRFKYKSDSRILLVGSGADEQCAGYGRHKTKFRQSGWAGLNEEMKLDMQRIWKRNLGRDDRCIADNGREGNSPVAVLFSGGLDSMILAALLDECLDPKFGIDLLNVSFDGQSAPDRISARAGVIELRKKASLRRWNLVEIDAELPKLTLEIKHVMSLINPSNTYMDLNIGIALWLAAGGDGWVCEEIGRNDDSEHQRFKYKSDSRILLVGSGADEQCAGYGRHKTKFRQSGWAGLNEEMKLDMQRIWKRNLGRDDRCIADNGREARFPFLDEDVIRLLLGIPLWEIADLGKPSGVGDKKILREVARMLHLHEAAILPKRAIQFGSRIARESNRKNFGSNRAANQASAGSALIHPI